MKSGSSSAGIRAISASNKGQTVSTREIEKCCEFFKVSRIGLVDAGRLGQQLNVSTQGQRAAQTGDERPFSLSAPGSGPQPRIEPGLHWWEADALPIGAPKAVKSPMLLDNSSDSG